MIDANSKAVSVHFSIGSRITHGLSFSAFISSLPVTSAIV